MNSCKPCDYRTDFDKKVIDLSCPWVLSQDTDPLVPLPKIVREDLAKKRENYHYDYSIQSSLCGNCKVKEAYGKFQSPYSFV
jgi:hypothetical protein